MGYAPQPVMMVAQQPQIVVIQQGGARVPWHSGECDLCAEPGGLPLCCYVHFCQPCAAGDVATAAGRDYFCSCCVAPVLGHLAHNDSLRDLIEGCA